MTTFTLAECRLGLLVVCGAVALGTWPPVGTTSARIDQFNDSHFHLTNYLQEGTDVRKYVDMMGTRVPRSTLYGIPRDSFTDAATAMAYRSLTPEQQSRLDPMIVGFNPTDMYAAEHIRRVLTTFPAVFSGIGEFTIDNEFVSPTVAGGTASLNDPALDRILDFAGEVGLVVILQNDIDMPFPQDDQDPYQLAQDPNQLAQLKELFKRHPMTSIIWAHAGVGRIVSPVENQVTILEGALSAPELRHVNIDISRDEVAKYIVDSPESVKATADLINRYPDRFIFGSDVVAPTDAGAQVKVFDMYAPLWELLSPEASRKVRMGNYERLFDEGRRRVRAWEAANVKTARQAESLQVCTAQPIG